MHDIWSPWHGCVKCSEGCDHCYMYFLDKIHGNKDGSKIYKTSLFHYPLQKNRQGKYKIQSGELIRVCMSSDFFLEEADEWREEAWKIMRERSDVKFFLLTKRPQRVAECLPRDWTDGWENIFSMLLVKTRNGLTNGYLSCWSCLLSIKVLCVPPLSGKSALNITWSMDRLNRLYAVVKTMTEQDLVILIGSNPYNQSAYPLM